ncbi:MAG: hypothetical protein HY298_08120 [Verrucomicrobia bacterium]|nr:hypothetical protein [Verrucomicrobiota bacterium]
MHKETLATFNEMDKAVLLKECLDKAGVHAEIYDESKLQKFWFMSESLAGKKIRIDEKDFETAKHVLEGLDAREDVLHDSVRCPQCKSPRIEYPQFTRKFITPTLVEIFCTLHLVEKEFYCMDCHFTWPKEEKPLPDLDVLGWPRKRSETTESAR